MKLVLLTALGVGGATVVGSVMGFFVKKVPRKFSDLIIGFAAGIMLAAAVWGLIVPSMGDGSPKEVLVTACGLMLGAVFIGACERFVPSLRFVAGGEQGGAETDGALMLVFAMAIHNLPEGIAAGVSLGSGDTAGALAVAGGIALQNIPEGMAVIPPMLAAGISRRRTFMLALFTGLTEVAGTFLGYRAVTFFAWLLPVSLAFAGGAMIYVITLEMIPCANNWGKYGAYVLVGGVCVMLLLNLAF